MTTFRELSLAEIAYVSGGSDMGTSDYGSAADIRSAIGGGVGGYAGAAIGGPAGGAIGSTVGGIASGYAGAAVGSSIANGNGNVTGGLDVMGNFTGTVGDGGSVGGAECGATGCY